MVILAWWIGFAVLMVLGIALARWGHRGARRGTRPHCRRCDYLLVGIDSGRCPECGAACKAADPAGVSPAAGD